MQSATLSSLRRKGALFLRNQLEKKIPTPQNTPRFARKLIQCPPEDVTQRLGFLQKSSKQLQNVGGQARERVSVTDNWKRRRRRANEQCCRCWAFSPTRSRLRHRQQDGRTAKADLSAQTASRVNWQTDLFSLGDRRGVGGRTQITAGTVSSFQVQRTYWYKTTTTHSGAYRVFFSSNAREGGEADKKELSLGGTARRLTGTLLDTFRRFSRDVEERGGLAESAKQKVRDALKKDPQAEKEEFYQFVLQSIMTKEGLFSYRRFLEFHREFLDWTGLTGVKGKLPWNKDNAVVAKVQSDIRILEAMLPDELDSDDPQVFTREAKEMIAEAAQVSVKGVNQLLLSHEIMKTDRTWFMRRILLGRPLPKTQDDRDYEALADRPQTQLLQFGQRRYSLEERAMINRLSLRERTRVFRPKNWPWFRHRTSGVDRWRTRPYTKGGASPYFPKQKHIPDYLYLRASQT